MLDLQPLRQFSDAWPSVGRQALQGQHQLVLAFHPSRAQGWLMADRWTRKANAEAFAAIYPNAIPNARSVVAWVVERDIPFVEALLEQARKNLPSLDPRRIYAMGFSNGAW